MSDNIDIRTLERYSSGEQLIVTLGNTRITVDTRGQADVTVEDRERVARVLLDDDYHIEDVDVLEGE